MALAIFKYKNYKAFLRDQIASQKQTRAYRSLLADAAGCQRSYLSQVLNGKADLTLDHAAGLAQFWSMGRDESDYFLEIVTFARASTPRLKKLIEGRIQQLQRKQEDLAQRFAASSFSGNDANTLYYSSWHWAALHVLASIPEFQDGQALASHLSLPLSYVQHCMEELGRIGMVESLGDGKWKVIKNSVHVPRASVHCWIHHSNWRDRALLDAQLPSSDGIHYTALHGLSVEDMGRVKELVLDLIDKSRAIVEPSSEETGICLSVDLFRI